MIIPGAEQTAARQTLLPDGRWLSIDAAGQQAFLSDGTTRGLVKLPETRRQGSVTVAFWDQNSHLGHVCNASTFRWKAKVGRLGQRVTLKVRRLVKEGGIVSTRKVNLSLRMRLIQVLALDSRLQKQQRMRQQLQKLHRKQKIQLSELKSCCGS